MPTLSYLYGNSKSIATKNARADYEKAVKRLSEFKGMPESDIRAEFPIGARFGSKRIDPVLIEMGEALGLSRDEIFKQLFTY